MNTTASNETAALAYLTDIGVVQIAEVILGILGIFGNSLVVLVILGVRSMRQHNYNTFLVSLAIADFLSSVMIIPYSFRGYFPIPDGRLAGELYCRVVSSTLLWWTLVASVFNLVGVTIERYVAIVHPLKYQTLFSPSRTNVFIATVWVVSIIPQLHCIYAVTYVHGKIICQLSWPSEQFAVFAGVGVFLVTYFIPLIVMLWAQWRILSSLKVSEKELSLHPHAAAVDNRRALDILRARRKVIVMLIVVVIAFAITWGPNQWFFLLSNFGIYYDFYEYTRTFALCNSFLNPVIYSFWSKKFRKSLRIFFCGQQSASNKTGPFDVET